MLAAAATFTTLALAPLLAHAAPIDSRIVPTLSCTALDPIAFANGLFVASSTVTGQLVPVGFTTGGNLTWETTGEGAKGDVQGEWGFEVCESTFLDVASEDNVWYGHTTFAPVHANGSASTDTLCLAATYEYAGSVPHLLPCSRSDDSGQFLLTWRLELQPSIDLNGTYVLNFVGPAGTVESYDAGLLGPSTYAPGGELVLAPANGTDASYFTFSADLLAQ